MIVLVTRCRKWIQETQLATSGTPRILPIASFFAATCDAFIFLHPTFVIQVIWRLSRARVTCMNDFSMPCVQTVLQRRESATRFKALRGGQWRLTTGLSAIPTSDLG